MATGYTLAHHRNSPEQNTPHKAGVERDDLMVTLRTAIDMRSEAGVRQARMARITFTYIQVIHLWPALKNVSAAARITSATSRVARSI